MRNKNLLLIQIILFLLPLKLKAQTSIPQGLSLDSVIIDEFHTVYNVQSFHCYKPISYDPATSPVIFAFHGSGGNGSIIIGDLMDIADRRHALIIAPNFPQSGYSTVTHHQEPTYAYADTDRLCVFSGSSTEILNAIYKHVLLRENRTNIPSYLIGFSAGGQFVSRYVWLRQAYPDSIPIQMAVSSNAYSYSFPTDTFLGTTMYWLCGTVMPTQFATFDCFDLSKFYSWNCNEQIVQYYNENYGVLIGTADVSPIVNSGCFAVTGNNRYERAQTFYNFADSNAVTRGTTLNWEYREVPGVGHDEYAMLNNKASPNDSSSIAESLLFDTPYHQVVFTSPVASFYANPTVVEINIPVNFINTSANSTSYLWDFGDSTTSTDVNPVHVYSTPGYYAIQLTASNSIGCDNWAVKTYYIYVTDPTSIFETNAEMKLLIYPNPTTGALHIKIPKSNYSSSSITIFDLMGKQVNQTISSQSRMDFDLTEINEGIYIIRIENNGNIYRKKVIKATTLK